MHFGLRNLFRHRVLIQSLVVRELKARYRGSVGGYVWSFLNPLLLLAVYTIVFTTIFAPPRATGADTAPYALFLFCGLLPWTWFAASLTDAANSLIEGGNLIKKLIFPAEVLPVVSVLANGVHYLLGLPVYLIVWLIFKGDSFAAGLSLHFLWLPLVILTQLILSLGLGLILAALAVHFRDIRDILANTLTLWFFLTPIIYSQQFLWDQAAIAQAEYEQGIVATYNWVPGAVARLLDFNPMSHIMEGYHKAIFEGALIPWKRLPVTLIVSLVVLWAGYWFFDRLRDSFPEEV